MLWGEHMSGVLLNPIAIADLTQRDAPAPQTIVAATVVAGFVAISIAAARLGEVHWPVLAPFIPICATLWGIADMLTAFLLFTQFSVNGVRSFAVLGAAYAVPAILTVPYVGLFPGLFLQTPHSIGMQQVSAWLWITWHVSFAAIVGVYHLTDAGLSARIASGRSVNRVLAGTLVACVVACGLTIALCITFEDRLTLVVIGGRFTSFYASVATPLIVGTNVGAAATILIVAKRRSTLQLWLVVALLTAALDGALNALSVGRYTASWYVGKLETLTTATVVLMVLLAEINVLYRRLGSMATIDGLTGLRNRQSFDNDATWTLGLRERTPIDLAYLVIDIDYFKQYNDLYGHQAGDECLRRVAASLRKTCGRASDLVGRFGGEEFVVFLTGATLFDATRVAEAVRQDVQALGIAHAGSSVARVVTVSVGAMHAPAQQNNVRLDTLFAAADTALYVSKVTRNAVTVV